MFSFIWSIFHNNVLLLELFQFFILFYELSYFDFMWSLTYYALFTLDFGHNKVTQSTLVHILV